MDASLAKKLLVRPETPFTVVAKPPEHEALLAGVGPLEGAQLVLLYAMRAAQVRVRLRILAKHHLRDGKRLWIAYPKANKLGTDLSRDVLAQVVAEFGFAPCRMISIDETWSAMWFKPGKVVPAARKDGRTLH